MFEGSSKTVSVLVLTPFWLGCGGGERQRPAPDRAVEIVEQAAVGFYQEVSWSPDASRLLISILEVDDGSEDFTYRIYVIGADGSEFRRLTNGPRDYWTSWSPDGSRIVFGSLRDGNYDIYAVDADGGNEVRLTDDPAEDGTPFWSPDGTQIAFVSDRSGTPQIHVMNADGSNQRQVGSSEAAVYNPVWSPNGRRLAYYTTDSAGVDHIQIMNADGTQAREVARGVWPSWSPDGSQIIYSGGDGLYVMSADGTNAERIIAGDAFFGEYAPDGSRIAYITNEEGSVSVNIINADGSGGFILLRRPAPEW